MLHCRLSFIRLSLLLTLFGCSGPEMSDDLEDTALEEIDQSMPSERWMSELYGRTRC